LETYTQYLISIQVFNPEGIGPPTNIVVMTDEGSKYKLFITLFQPFFTHAHNHPNDDNDNITALTSKTLFINICEWDLCRHCWVEGGEERKEGICNYDLLTCNSEKKHFKADFHSISSDACKMCVYVELTNDNFLNCIFRKMKEGRGDVTSGNKFVSNIWKRVEEFLIKFIVAI
jgi:hypothetical protein